jgi:multisubunit Na+/H+ antiporter MnhC subunit
MMTVVAITVACAPLIAKIKNISSIWKLMDILQTGINLRINMGGKKKDLRKSVAFVTSACDAHFT